MAASLEKNDVGKVTLARTWYQSLWSILAQPLLQTLGPHFLMGLIIFAPLNWVLYLKEVKKQPLHWLLPVFWVYSGTLAGLACAGKKWVLVGKKKEGETMQIWSRGIFMDTIWQAIRTQLVGEYFMEMTGGSFLFGLWMKLMGSEIYWDQGKVKYGGIRIGKGGFVGSRAVAMPGAGVVVESGGSLGALSLAMKEEIVN